MACTFGMDRDWVGRTGGGEPRTDEAKTNGTYSIGMVV